MNKKEKISIYILVLLGFLSSFYYIYWWIELGIIGSYWLKLIFAGALFHIVAQVYFLWFIYLKAKYPSDKLAPPNLKVDIFLPIYNEPEYLIEKALEAANKIEYPHKTYLIDDGNNGYIKSKAESYGAVYIKRSNNKDYKAGNINNALNHSEGDLIAVFDLDHLPNKDYLEKSLGYFDDPKIGVVQIALDHYNSDVSYVAEACSKMNDDFFGTTMFGMDGLNSAVVFGSNSIFRREALKDLGGYKPGLAEDLNTSIHLHAKGWKSAYVPLILAKGLVPEDLAAFFKQQFKWSRGVFDTLFIHYPKLFFKLKLNHHISYVNRMTYYLAGLVVVAHIIFALTALLNQNILIEFNEYLLHSMPVLFMFFIIQIFIRRSFKVKETPPGLNLRGIILVLGTWPVYTSAFLSAVFKINIPFIPTPKERTNRSQHWLIMPQLLASILLLMAITYNLIFLEINSVLVIGFSLLLVFIHYGVFYSYFESLKTSSVPASSKMALNRVKK